MKLPISWLKDYIDLDGLSVEDVARKLTLAGLEVEDIKYVGLPMPSYDDDRPVSRREPLDELLVRVERRPSEDRREGELPLPRHPSLGSRQDRRSGDS